MNEELAKDLECWDTATLIGICYRVTPRHELDDWIATAGKYTWVLFAKTGEFVKYRDGRLIDARAADKMRRDVIEQLAYYKVSRSRVNFMKS